MDINATLLGQAITFAILIWFTLKFVWPPLLNAIEARRKTIADGLAAGERGKHELELAAKRSAEVLREAKQQAQEIVAQAEKHAAQLIEEAKGSAQVEGEKLIAGARSQIEDEASRAREALRSQVSALALKGAEKILRREVDAKTHADILTGIEKEL
jgi:F-type H+-transporting ATPase subunit b